MAENKIRENTIKPAPTPPVVEEETPQVIASAPEPKKKPVEKEKKEKRPEKPKKEKAPKEKTPKEKKPHEKDPRIGYVGGFLLLCLALFLSLGFISFFVSYFSGSYHETSTVIFNKNIQFDNITGKFGAFLSQVLIKESFGLGALFFPYLLTVIGLHLTIGTKIRMWHLWKHAIMLLAWIPLLFAFINFSAPNKACEIFGGAVGKFLNANIYEFMGNSGVILTLVFVFLLYLLFEYNLNIDAIRQWRERRAERKALKQQQLLQQQQNINHTENPEYDTPDDGEHPDLDNPDDDLNPDDYDDELPPITVIHRPTENTIREENHQDDEEEEDEEDEEEEDEIDQPEDQPEDNAEDKPQESQGVTLVIEDTPEEKTIQDGEEHHTIDTPYDPHFELRDFKFPTLDLLNDYGDKRAEVSNEELEANKNKIVETLGNYGIKIDKIKATIGPTVTLYEIIPAAGVRISKIKNLEDDIALSLAALGIRIIAPIPGKGTIGIEVPNKKPETVSMKSVLASEKFQNNKFALPCAIGKTISNETYVFDLAKMPHILMAGATGQGKSVGLNAIIASLLYSKHPSDLKFIMVDPKKDAYCRAARQ